MNLPALFAFCCLFLAKPESLTVIDLNGKTPPRSAEAFSPDQFISRNFPVYTADLPTLAEALQRAAKRIDRKPACYSVDTVAANHTLVIVKTDCGKRRQLTVRLVTRIERPKFLCDFEMVRREEDGRKAQRQLLDFAAYLSQ